MERFTTEKPALIHTNEIHLHLIIYWHIKSACGSRLDNEDENALNQVPLHI